MPVSASAKPLPTQLFTPMSTGIQQRDGHPADADFSRVADSIVVRVDEHIAAETARQRFGKVIANAVFPAEQHNIADDVHADDYAASLVQHAARRRADAEIR